MSIPDQSSFLICFLVWLLRGRLCGKNMSLFYLLKVMSHVFLCEILFPSVYLVLHSFLIHDLLLFISHYLLLLYIWLFLSPLAPSGEER